MELAGQDLGVGIVTQSIEAASRYYCDVLGFRRGRESALAGGARRRIVHAGRNRVELIQLATPPPPRHDGAIYAANGIRVLAVFLDDLPGTMEAIRASGRRVAEATDLPGELKITFAKDADGNMLELIGLPHPAPGLDSRLQIGLTVNDVEASRRFYGEGLDLPEQPPLPMPGGITRHAFSAGRTTIKFWSTGDRRPTQTGAPGAAVGLRFIRLEVANAEAVAELLRARGAPVVEQAADWAAADERVAGVRDPDGNWLLLAEG